jgi:hypothetical protein
MAEMSMVTRKELFKKSRKRYLKADKREKTKILDELSLNTECHRKYIIRKMQAKQDDSPKTRKRRKQIYDNQFVPHLVKIWKIFDYPCSQNLEDYMPEALRVLKRNKRLNVSEEMENKLLKIKSATIDRKLKRYKGQKRKKINSGTKPGTLLKKNIPIRTSSWDEKRIGYCELDTVLHCGNSASGEFAVSLNLTDILTQWTEEEAVLGKGEKGIIKALDNIKSRLPFALLAIDPDNGSEFINWQMYKYTLKEKIEFTRGRPYKKNDNAHIEQKNWTHIRKLFGLRRLETQKNVAQMNELYRNELRLYKNFFIANKKLISKKYVGTKVVKKYDNAKTPYQRVLQSKQVSKKKKEQLTAFYLTLDPVQLKEKIDYQLSRIY